MLVDTETETTSGVVTTYETKVGNLRFTYAGGETGYTLIEMTDAPTEMAALSTIPLVPTRDYRDEQTRVGGESSLLSIYENTERLQPGAWASKYLLQIAVSRWELPLKKWLVEPMRWCTELTDCMERKCM